jgi:hypothetical protein
MKKHFYHQPKAISAFEAKFNALKISFSPVTFQVSFCLYELGVLDYLSTCGEKGETAREIALKLNLSEYGVKVYY